jgi:hypothetical protein
MVSALETGWLHWYPDSTVHVDEQPSPLLVLPSSHPSLTTRPSPHFDVHWPVAALQLGSKWQVGEQPSLGRVLPSSQPSDPSTFPSPHFVWWQLGGLPAQAQPSLYLHVLEQALSMFVPGALGSHCSMGLRTMPSPQSGTHGALVNGQA